jgi:hypothetical protein
MIPRDLPRRDVVGFFIFDPPEPDLLMFNQKRWGKQHGTEVKECTRSAVEE